MIADVAVAKRHQRPDELLIFLPALYRKSAKMFMKKLPETCELITSVCRIIRAHFLHIYNKRILCEHDCVKFRGCIA